MSHITSSLGLSCPSGGSFDICQGNATQFLGCCTSDPCSDGKGDCPQSDLRYASFAASDYGKIDAQACSGGSGAAAWYTFLYTTHPFWGTVRALLAVLLRDVPVGVSAAARLSDTQGNAAVFLTAAGNVCSDDDIFVVFKVDGDLLISGNDDDRNESDIYEHPNRKVIIGAYCAGYIIIFWAICR